MNPIFKKLNFKNQAAILVVNSPDSFQKVLVEMQKIAPVITEVDNIGIIDFAVSFVDQKNKIEEIVKAIASKWSDDPVIWFCYPKGTSKKYKCDFNRDSGWESLGKYNLEPVRQVAIDEDWSALRFRKVGHIKSMSRRENFALTEEGRNRTKKD